MLSTSLQFGCLTDLFEYYYELHFPPKFRHLILIRHMDLIFPNCIHLSSCFGPHFLFRVMWPRLSLNSKRACLSLLNTEISDMPSPSVPTIQGFAPHRSATLFAHSAKGGCSFPSSLSSSLCFLSHHLVSRCFWLSTLPIPICSAH